MITKEQIKFHNIKPETKTHETCCACGKKFRTGSDTWEAKFAINEMFHSSFIVCSLACVVKFFMADDKSSSDFITKKVKADAVAVFLGMYNPPNGKELLIFLKKHNIPQ